MVLAHMRIHGSAIFEAKTHPTLKFAIFLDEELIPVALFHIRF